MQTMPHKRNQMVSITKEFGGERKIDFCSNLDMLSHGEIEDDTQIYNIYKLSYSICTDLPVIESKDDEALAQS